MSVCQSTELEEVLRRAAPEVQFREDARDSSNQLVRSFLVSVNGQIRALMHTVGHCIERHFAAFAHVPHETLLTREQWEELWESDAQCEFKAPSLNSTSLGRIQVREIPPAA
jgi:hypothetical protein